jgi:hypothetical protein
MSWPVACFPNHFHNLKKHLFSIIANFCGGMYLGTGIVWKIFYNANKFAAGICRKKLQIHVQIKDILDLIFVTKTCIITFPDDACFVLQQFMADDCTVLWDNVFYECDAKFKDNSHKIFIWQMPTMYILWQNFSMNITSMYFEDFQ